MFEAARSCDALRVRGGGGFEVDGEEALFRTVAVAAGEPDDES